MHIFCFLYQVQAEAEAEAVDGDSLPLSPEELELLEEVEKVKEEVEEKKFSYKACVAEGCIIGRYKLFSPSQ